MWPRRSINYCDEVTRDFCFGVKDIDQRKVMMLPWVKSKIDIPVIAPLKQISFFENISKLINANLPALDTNFIPFISLPETNIKVFTKSKSISKSLTSERYQFVEEKVDADIIWLESPAYDFESFFDDGPQQIVNSFPYDYLMTVTAYLSELTKYDRDTPDEQNPSWFRTTYDMLTEFDSFVSNFIQNSRDKGILGKQVLDYITFEFRNKIFRKK